ncbi:MAG: protein-L-isoaspartate(D-aspartate) O-methyltransferase [Bacteroidetes bacterium]|nr:protein-L-isoaspartate(D-aspartate) O-methyltransferase [Bacteroidota bacterium]
MNTPTDTYKHKGQRRKLASSLLLKNITDINVLNAIEVVPRHFFLPKDFEERAYEDNALPIDEEQTISQPYTVAFQTQSLNIKPGDKVLEIGTGSGYQAAILASMGAHVYTIERIEKLYNKAKKILCTYKNVHCFMGDGSMGLPENSPFDKIIVTAAAPKIPDSLINQLKIGGKAIIPVGDLKNQKMILINKTDENTFTEKNLGDFRFVPLIGKEAWK